MKKRVLYIITACIIVFFFLITGGQQISSPILRMKTLAFTQRLIPVFYVHPKDRIVAYIGNADDLFALSTPESALRAEHSMTLVVSELRRLHDTSIIPYALIFDTFKNQYLYTTDETIKAFMRRNENTAKTIYYSKLPPGKPVRL